MATQFDNVSYDLIWETIRHSNAFLVKRKQGGGVQLSRDPLNLTNKHSRKYSSLANSRAIGINGAAEANAPITITTKTNAAANKPAKGYQTATVKGSVPSRKLYRTAINTTAKKGYRGDLQQEVVKRAAAVKYSQKAKKDAKPTPARSGRKNKAVAVEA